MPTWLSPHFTLEEFTVTQHRDIDNIPPDDLQPALHQTAAGLESVRRLLDDHAVIVTSGYRSARLNRAVGGASHSAHVRGEAVDFICPEFGDVAAIVRRVAAGPVRFDQLIDEGRWAHLSFDPRMRGEVLKRTPAGTYERILCA